MATQAQIKKIHVLKREKNLTDEQYRTFLRDRYGVESSKDLSNRQASDFIEFLLQLGLSAAGLRLVPPDPPRPPEPEPDDLLDDPEWTTLQRILAKLEGIETRLARLERLVERLESKSSFVQPTKRKRPKIRRPDDPALLF